MRIHTSACTEEDLRHGAKLAGVSFVRLARRGSRSHGTAFDVVLSGSGARCTQYRATDWKAATWDEWGVFLAHVFDRDAGAKTAQYSSAEHFHWSTDSRFGNGLLSPVERHWRHKWRYLGHVVTGAYVVKECTGCPALLRVLSPGYSFEGLG